MANKHNALLTTTHTDSFVLSTLSADTALLQATKIDATRENGVYIPQITMQRLTWADKTASEGPISFGLTCNKTIAEIGSYIEADPQNSFGEAKNDDAHQALIKVIAVLDFIETSLTLWNNGIPMVIPVKWTIPERSQFSFFAYNHDSSALTTGTVIRVAADILQRWLRD